MLQKLNRLLFVFGAANFVFGFAAARADSLLVEVGDAVGEYTTSGTFVKTFVSAGSGGLSVGGRDIAFGPNGNLYIPSEVDGTIKEYSGQNGAYLGNFATGLPGAVDIAFDSQGRAYVAQYTANQISQLSATGTLLQTFTSMVSTPEGLTAMPNGHLLVDNTYAGAYRDTVTEIDPTTGNESTFATGLGEPVGITRGPDGRYYAANGAFAASYGGTNPDTVQVIGASGGTSNTFNVGGGLHGADYLAFDGGDLFVSSYYNNTVQEFDGTSGAYIGSFAVSTSSVGPSGIAVMPEAAPLPASGWGGLILISGFGLMRFVRRPGRQSSGVSHILSDRT